MNLIIYVARLEIEHWIVLFTILNINILCFDRAATFDFELETELDVSDQMPHTIHKHKQTKCVIIKWTSDCDSDYRFNPVKKASSWTQANSIAQ